MIRLPNLNRMRTSHRQSQKLIDRMERTKRHKKERLTWKMALSVVALALITVPLRTENARIVHGIVSWCALGALLMINYFEWRSKAPLTRWRKAKTMSLTVGVVALLMPLFMMLFKAESTPENWELYGMMWGGAGVMFAYYLYSVRRWRCIKAESSYRAEQIRRRMARQKRMELL